MNIHDERQLSFIFVSAAFTAVAERTRVRSGHFSAFVHTSFSVLQETVVRENSCL